MSRKGERQLEASGGNRKTWPQPGCRQVHREVSEQGGQVEKQLYSCPLEADRKGRCQTQPVQMNSGLKLGPRRLGKPRHWWGGGTVRECVTETSSGFRRSHLPRPQVLNRTEGPQGCRGAEHLTPGLKGKDPAWTVDRTARSVLWPRRLPGPSLSASLFVLSFLVRTSVILDWGPPNSSTASP